MNSHDGVTAKNLIRLAKYEANRTKSTMWSSAALALGDAETLLASGNERYAVKRAINSLEYSIGCFQAKKIERML